MEIPHSPDKMIYNLNTHYFKVASLAQGEAIQYLQLLAKEAMHFNDSNREFSQEGPAKNVFFVNSPQN